jgi:hypothetical protein
MTNERFVRWQGQTMAQLSTTLTLILGLSVGGLGLSLSLLRQDDFNPTGVYAVLFLVTLATLFLASAAGIAALITRLVDFRLTAMKVRAGSTDEPLTLFGTDASNYGKATWRLFWSMMVLFALSVFCFAIVISRVYLRYIIDAIGY